MNGYAPPPHTEAVLGLPGLMCTINASRERGHEFADIPVHVYGPPGTAAFLVAMMRVSQTYLEITVVVHEVRGYTRVCVCVCCGEEKEACARPLR